MKFSNFQYLELNEQNVIKTFSQIIANPEDKDTRAVSYMEKPYISVAKPINFKTHTIPLVQIDFLFGQLKAAHDHKRVLTTGDFTIDYTGQPWTKDPKVLIIFLYLGAYAGTIDKFIIENNKPICYLDGRISGVTPPFYPTYSPKDSRFDPKHPFISQGVEYETEE